MSIYVAVDSNALTYLLEALQEGYDPSLDNTDVAGERVAMVRCFLYGGCSFWVTPTAQAEYRNIKDADWRQTHDRWTKNLLQDVPLGTPEHVLAARAAELQVHHTAENDCRVVAETEFAKLDTLLSRDGNLSTKLGNHTHVRILRPTVFWASLGIAPNATPLVQPAGSNALAQVSWWRLQSVII